MNQIYKYQKSFIRGREKEIQQNSKNHTIFAMNEVIYQGISDNSKELLLGGMSAKYLLEWILSLCVRKKQKAPKWIPL